MDGRKGVRSFVLIAPLVWQTSRKTREGLKRLPSGARVNLHTAEQVPEVPSHSPSPQPLARSGALASFIWYIVCALNSPIHVGGIFWQNDVDLLLGILPKFWLISVLVLVSQFSENIISSYPSISTHIPQLAVVGSATESPPAMVALPPQATPLQRALIGAPLAPGILQQPMGRIESVPGPDWWDHGQNGRQADGLPSAPTASHRKSLQNVSTVMCLSSSQWHSEYNLMQSFYVAINIIVELGQRHIDSRAVYSDTS